MRRGKEQPPAMSAPLLHQSATSHAAVTHTSSHRDVLQRSSGSSHPPHAREHSTAPQQDLQQIDHPRAANSDNGEQGSFCTHCGGSVAPAARFCAICGSRSSQSRAASAARADDHGTAGSELHQSAPEQARSSELHLSSELHVAHELENATRHLSTGIELLSLPARKVDASKGFVRSAVHILLRTASLQSHFALQESVRCWLSNREESFERVSRNRLETSCETLALRVMGGVMHRWQHVQLATIITRWSSNITENVQDHNYAAVLKSTGITLKRQKESSELLLQQKNVLLAESDFRFEQLQQEVEQNYTVIEQLRRELNSLSNRASDEQSQMMHLQMQRAQQAQSEKRLELEKLELANELAESQNQLSQLRKEFAKHLDLQLR